MSDNDKRHRRILELGDQTKLYLDQARTDYEQFQLMCAKVTADVSAVYTKAGLRPPDPKAVEILKYTEVGHTKATSEVAIVLEVIADISFFVSTTRSLGPPAAKWLSDTGKMPAKWAEKEILRKSKEILANEMFADEVGGFQDALVEAAAEGAGDELAQGLVAQGVVQADADALAAKAIAAAKPITGADIAGHILSGVVAGVAVGAIDLTIYFAQQALLKGHLIAAIEGLHPLRTAMLITRRRTREALDSLQATEAMVDALAQQAPTLQAKALAGQENTIVGVVEAALENAASLPSLISELKNADATAQSYIADDPDYPS